MRLTKELGEMETALVREFACGELYRLVSMSPPERQERIRVAILSAGLQNKLFGDSGVTYAQFFRLTFKKPCELRRYPRDTERPIVRDAPGDTENIV